MKLRFTTNAQRRLAQIKGYHNDMGNPKKGRRVARQILDRAKALEEYPDWARKKSTCANLARGTVLC